MLTLESLSNFSLEVREQMQLSDFGREIVNTVALQSKTQTRPAGPKIDSEIVNTVTTKQ